MNVFVTGASGFVGTGLCQQLVANGHAVVAGVRTPTKHSALPFGVDARNIGDIAMASVSPVMFLHIDAVVHLASRVHVMNETASDPLTAFRRVNVDGTLNLARAAAKAGVKRFVFLSSIKVNGEATLDQPFDHASTPAPCDAYGISKWEAEQALHALARETGMEVVIIRPPLVYGPRVGANFLRLMRLVESGLPLPLGAVNNRRSMVYLGNLVDLIRVCLTHPAAAGETFLAADGEDVSTPELLRRLAAVLGVPARLLPFPAAALRFAAKCVGKGAEADRLLGSLQVDTAWARQRLGWQAPFSLDEGLRETAQWYRASRAS